MLVPTMLETSTNTGLQQDMCLHCSKHWSVGALFYSLLLHCLLQSPSIQPCRAIKEAIWLQGLLNDLGIDHDLLKINYNSMNAIYLVKNQVYHTRMKHVDVMFHFVRDIFDEGDIELQKIYTKKNPTNMLTKVVRE